MTSLITRCPKCATAFNVTEAHLNSANGSVRCGSCLNVFNGRQYLSNTTQKEPVLLDDDDLLISDDLELDELAHSRPAPAATSDRVKEIIEKARHAEPEELEEVDDDESWALKLLEEEGHNPSQLGLKEKPPAPPEVKTQTPSPNPSDDIPRAACLEDTGATPEFISAPTDSEETTAHEPTQAALKAQEYATSKAQEPEPEPEIAEQALAELQQELEVAKEAGQLEEAGPRTLVDAIEIEAVELQYTAKRPAWLSRLIWLFLATLAAAALAGQIAWLKFNELSLKEPYRQYYGMACEHLGCTLPQLKDLSKIRTTNLLVRTHPTTEGALLVDVVIQNHARFEQPFPKLTLVFSNIKNKVVASRAFSPGEYLGGDLTGASLMPAKKAIHLSLELVDPGKGAVSYKITIDE